MNAYDGQRPKKRYEKPLIQRFGLVSELTGLVGLNGHDGLSGTSLTGDAKAKRYPPQRTLRHPHR